MFLVIVYSILLIGGILCSQFLNLVKAHVFWEAITSLCLAYIMIEVGLEFKMDKTRLKSYGWDFFFAFLAAALPWIFCAVYFIYFLHVHWSTAFLVGVFAAPTSAGVLFAMLAAAGLGASWLFRKAQVLAIFDDFAAILLLLPMQIIYIGFKPELFLVIFFVIIFLMLAFRFLHSLSFPIGQYWMILYGVVIVVIRYVVHKVAGMDLGVLLPAFTLGAVLYNPHLYKEKKDSSYDESHQEPAKGAVLSLQTSVQIMPFPLTLRLRRAVLTTTVVLFSGKSVDRFIKGSFMFLVGLSLPKINLDGISAGMFISHVLALTLLSNLGKCFLFFCYRREVSWRNRLALSIAMFPRGEVGAGVLLVAMGYGLNNLVVSLSVLSLALNLVLTGVFIILAIRLAQPVAVDETSKTFSR